MVARLSRGRSSWLKKMPAGKNVGGIGMQKNFEQLRDEEIFWLIAMLNPDTVEAVWEGLKIKFIHTDSGGLDCLTSEQDDSSSCIFTDKCPRLLNLPSGWVFYSNEKGGILKGRFCNPENRKHSEELIIPTYKENGDPWLS